MDRLDTKYVFADYKISELLTRIDRKYRVLDIKNSRSFLYSTTYLDTQEYMFYYHHVTDRRERNKVRFRKYDSTGVGFLEVKRRTNKDRTIKWRIENNYKTGNKLDNSALEFLTRYIPVNPDLLKPVLLNNFKRITLVNIELKERLTIDYDISFTGLDNKRAELPNIAVLEVKRDELKKSRSQPDLILKDLSVRPFRLSKYCIGAALLYDIPRKNVLKPKFLQINRINHEFIRS